MSDEETQADPAPPSPATEREYEFSAAQNKVFEELADNLGFLGWFTVVVVVTFHVVLLVRWATQGVPPYPEFRLMQLVWPVLLLVGAAGFVRASRSFRLVVETQGSDIRHLMDGLRGLNGSFEWLSIVPRIWVVVAVIAAAVGLVLGLIHWAGY